MLQTILSPPKAISKHSFATHQTRFILRLTRLVLFIMFTFLLVILAAKKLSGHDSPSISWATFENNLPNQRIDTLQRWDDCSQSISGSSFDCVVQIVHLSGPIFTRVKVKYMNGEMVQVDYIMKPNSIRVGDLITIWGTPKSRENDNTTHFYFYDDTILAEVTRHDGTVAYGWSVSRVVIADTAFTDLSQSVQ